MKKKTEADLQEWVNDVRSKLADQPERLGAFDTFVGKTPEDSLAVFGGVMAEREFYRHKNELHEQEKALQELTKQNQLREKTLVDDAMKLQNWYDGVAPRFESAVQEAQKARAALRELGLTEEDVVATKPGSTPSAVTADNPIWNEIQQLRSGQALMNQAIPQALSEIADIFQRAQAEGYKFDSKQLFATASQENVNLGRAYEIITSEERMKRASEQREKDLADARAQGERDALTKLSSPDQLRSPRPMSGFGQPTQVSADKQTRVRDAVLAYTQLGQEAFDF